MDQSTAVALGMTWKDLLGLSVFGALVSTLGGLIALVMKEFVAARSFERWKAEQALASIFNRYRRPLCASAKEMSWRFYGLSRNKNRENGIKFPDVMNDGSRYRRYRLISNAYRFCCFLGWIEMYRRDLGLLDVGKREDNRELDVIIDQIRSDIADGQLNPSRESELRRDKLIFREEQRAIAHRMIKQDGQGLIDFGTFSEIVELDPDGQADARWFKLAVMFFADLQPDNDFRRERMKRLVVHLNSLQMLLRPDSVPPDHIESTEHLANELGLQPWRPQRIAG